MNTLKSTLVVRVPMGMTTEEAKRLAESLGNSELAKTFMFMVIHDDVDRIEFGTLKTQETHEIRVDYEHGENLRELISDMVDNKFKAYKMRDEWRGIKGVSPMLGGLFAPSDVMNSEFKRAQDKHEALKMLEDIERRHDEWKNGMIWALIATVFIYICIVVGCLYFGGN